jgi:hypothetical protein
MPSWVIDDPSLLLFCLGALALLLGAAWWRSRKGAYAIGAGISAGLIALVLLLSAVLETDNKRIERAVEEMAAGVESHNIGRIFDHVAGTFQAGGLDREAFRRHVALVMARYEIQGVHVWDYEAKEISRKEKSARVVFKAKARGLEQHEGLAFYNCLATFVLEPDGQWRMASFQVFMPTVDPMRGEPLPLPGR